MRIHDSYMKQKELLPCLVLKPPRQPSRNLHLIFYTFTIQWHYWRRRKKKTQKTQTNKKTPQKQKKPTNNKHTQKIQPWKRRKCLWRMFNPWRNNFKVNLEQLSWILECKTPSHQSLKIWKFTFGLSWLTRQLVERYRQFIHLSTEGGWTGTLASIFNF